jgi:two-component system, OmpR family, phosphate regulon sensor histidine kinase PhoR
MTARIFLKLALAVVLMMAVALAAIDFLASEMAQKIYVDALKQEMSEKTRMLGVLDREALIQLRPEVVVRLAGAAGGRLTIVDHDGRVLHDSDADASRMENHAQRPEVRAALNGETGHSVRGSPTTGVNYLYVAAPVNSGAVRLAMPLREVSGQIGVLRGKLVLYTAVAFIPAILLALLFARFFARRLGAIIDYASTLAKGDFRASLDVRGNDELGILGRQLNETGAKLQKMFEELEHEHVELEKLERIRKDFVINVSHELRTPLASIQGYTETLLDGAINDQDNNIRFLNIVRQNAERLGRLTADLLTISRIELKSQRFQFASYRLAPLLAECVDSLRPVALKKNITMWIDPGEEGLEVFCDSESVHQMMSNLIDNAIKYTPDGGSIHVAARALPGSMVEVGVRDTGMGIPQEDLGRLFERFYRVDKARSREMGGTGLGLAIVKHLARAQGGDVRVESEPGQGSTFSFTLPVEDLGISEDAPVQTQLTQK